MIKTFLFLVLAVLVGLMVKNISLGRTLAKQDIITGSSVFPHKRIGRWIFFIQLASVGIIRLIVSQKGGVQAYDATFWVHVSAAILFFIGSYFLNWPISGQSKVERSHKGSHKRLAYAATVFFTIMVITSVPIILRMDKKQSQKDHSITQPSPNRGGTFLIDIFTY